VSELNGRTEQAGHKHWSRVAIVAGVTGAISLSLRRSMGFVWLQGRSNDAIPGFLLTHLAGFVWLVCGVSLLVIILRALAGRRGRTVATTAVLLLLSCLPWLLNGISPDPFTAYLDGFVQWVRRNIQVLEVQDCLSQLHADVQPTPGPRWLPTMDPDDQTLGVPLPVPKWPRGIVQAAPPEVRILQEQEEHSLILLWPPGTRKDRLSSATSMHRSCRLRTPF